MKQPAPAVHVSPVLKGMHMHSKKTTGDNFFCYSYLPTIGIIPLYGGAAANGPTDSWRAKKTTEIIGNRA